MMMPNQEKEPFARSLSLCDELFQTMYEIQQRLENRRENMMRNAAKLNSASHRSKVK
jgi:hypothetical protein